MPQYALNSFMFVWLLVNMFAMLPPSPNKKRKQLNMFIMQLSKEKKNSKPPYQGCGFKKLAKLV
jgi:hypothetical protein